MDRIVEDLINDDTLESETDIPTSPDQLDDDELSRFSLDSLMDDDSFIHHLPPYSFIEKPMEMANNEEWANWKQHLISITEATDRSPGEIGFDPLDQPETEAYGNNPSILIAKRNISSAKDILDYLGSLMGQQTVAEEIGTTKRSFFKPDLLPEGVQEEVLVQEESRPTIDDMNKKNSLILTAEDIMQAVQVVKHEQSLHWKVVMLLTRRGFLFLKV